MALGFTKIDAAQAYFACDKNEELAANLLFDRMANGDLEPLEDAPQGNNEDEDDDDNLFGWCPLFKHPFYFLDNNYFYTNLLYLKINTNRKSNIYKSRVKLGYNFQ